MERIVVFLILFTIVYFLESIGGSYINSAVQNIERQFQMSSQRSGMMIAASDFGYIPCVVFTAYFGSRGNRAKWIGGGAIVVAISYLMLASPNFLFPVGNIELNNTEVAAKLVPTMEQLSPNSTLRQLLDYPLIRDRIPKKFHAELMQLQDDTSLISPYAAERNRTVDGKRTVSYTVDGWIIDKFIMAAEELMKNESSTDQQELRGLLSQFVHRRSANVSRDLRKIQRSAAAPFAFCGKMVNKIRSTIKASRCETQSDSIYPFGVFFLSLLILGIGRTVPWSLGLPLLDDNIKKKSLPAYFGAISSIRVLGPICGYLIGSACNKFYFTLHAPPGLTPADPTWIGAWWIGFIFIGCITFFPSVVLYFFPAGKQQGRSVQLFDAHKNHAEEHKTFNEKVKDFLNSCKAVFKSKIYTGSVIGRICDVLAFKGYLVFLPKYLENHFGIPQYLVHRYMAMFGVFGFGLGTAVGGFLTRALKLNGRKAALFVAVVSTLNVVIYSTKIFIGCESIVNSIGLNNKETNYNFTRSCNADCDCDGVKLYPVCDKTGFAYFSPCHAGCREARAAEESSNYNLDFSSCECAAGGSVSKKFCKDTCGTATVFFFMTVLPGAFVAGLGVVPGILILLRSVPPESRSLCLGLQGLMVSLFGTLPSPILWGFIIDSACLVWDHTCSGQRGACAIYHPQRLRHWMHALYVLIRGISLTMDVYVWWHSKHLNIMEEPVKEEPDLARKQSIKMQPVVTEN